MKYSFHLSSKAYRSFLFGPLLFVLLFSMTDFGLYLSQFLFVAVFFLFSMYFGMALFVSKSINLFLVIYSILVPAILVINYLYSPNYNFMLLTPLLSFVVFYAIRTNAYDLKILLDVVVKLFAILVLLVGFFEIFVKLTAPEILLYTDFIKEYGDKRFDVLRTRTLFGSSLSTAALSIFFVVFFLFFSHSNVFLFLSFLVSMLSGSRTAIVIILFLFFFLSFKSVYLNSLSKRSVLLVVATLFSLISIIIFTPVGNIALRSISVSMDESFKGRSHTSVQTLIDLIDQFPSSFFIGLQTGWTSDSAITSIMAGSGVLSFFFIFSFFGVFIVKDEINFND